MHPQNTFYRVVLALLQFYSRTTGGRSNDFFRGENTFRKFSKKIIKKIAKNVLFQQMKFGEILRNFSKNFFRKLRKKIQKKILQKSLAYFSKNLTKHALVFLRQDEKHNVFEILRYFSEFFIIFLKKIAKNALLQHLFQKI